MIPELVTIHTSLITDLGDAVRERFGVSGEMTIEEMTGIVSPELPSEYQQVEYIEGNGAKLIDTGLSGIALNDLRIDCYISNATGNNGTDICYGQYMNSNRFFTVFLKGTQRCGFYGTGDMFNYNQSDLITSGETHLEVIGNGIIDDGKALVMGTYATSTPLGNILLFGEQVARASTHRFHYCKIGNSNGWQRDYVPCYLKADNTQVGFYDMVSKTLNTGTGTGAFIAGPDI